MSQKNIRYIHLVKIVKLTRNVKRRVLRTILSTGGKPSTRFPPGGTRRATNTLFSYPFSVASALAQKCEAKFQLIYADLKNSKKHLICIGSFTFHVKRH